MSRQLARSVPKEQEHRVFVYGTLRQGESRRGALEESIEISKKAQLAGFKMYHLGGFPGIVRIKDDEKANPILGELYQINENTLAVLDRIEGHREEDPRSSFYRRTEVSVLVPGKDAKPTFISCWTYVFNDPRRIKNCPVIESGDWFEGRDMRW